MKTSGDRSTPPPSNPSRGRDSPTLSGSSKSGLGPFKKALSSPFSALKKLLRRPKKGKGQDDRAQVHHDRFPVPDLAASTLVEDSEPAPPVAFSSSGSLSSIELTPFVASSQQITPLVNAPSSESAASMDSSPAASTAPSDESLAPTISSATCSVSSLSTLSTFKASEGSPEPATTSSTGTGSFVSEMTSPTKGGSPRTSGTSPDNCSQATLSTFSSSPSDQFENGLANGPVLSYSSESEPSSMPPSKRSFCSPATKGSSKIVEFSPSSALRGSALPFVSPPWSTVNTSPAPDDDGARDDGAEPAPSDEEYEEESQLTEIALKDDKGPNAAAAILPSLAFQSPGTEVDPHPRSPTASSLSYFCNFFSSGGRFLSFGGTNGNLVSSPGHQEDDDYLDHGAN